MSAGKTITWILALGIVASTASLLTYRLVTPADSSKPHSAALTWKPPSHGAISYNIYRSSVSGKDYKKIGSSKEPKYVDTPLLSGAIFYYVVTSVTDKGESAYSSEIKVVVP